MPVSPEVMETVLKSIDLATDPGRMTLEEAKEFLEHLATEVDMRIDGIKDDLRTKE